nr:unnamed protein product [Digitaria exilis]
MVSRGNEKPAKTTYLVVVVVAGRVVRLSLISAACSGHEAHAPARPREGDGERDAWSGLEAHASARAPEGGGVVSGTAVAGATSTARTPGGRVLPAGASMRRALSPPLIRTSWPPEGREGTAVVVGCEAERREGTAVAMGCGLWKGLGSQTLEVVVGLGR